MSQTMLATARPAVTLAPFSFADLYARVLLPLEALLVNFPEIGCDVSTKQGEMCIKVHFSPEFAITARFFEDGTAELDHPDVPSYFRPFRKNTELILKRFALDLRKHFEESTCRRGDRRDELLAALNSLA